MERKNPASCGDGPATRPDWAGESSYRWGRGGLTELALSIGRLRRSISPRKISGDGYPLGPSCGARQAMRAKSGDRALAPPTPRPPDLDGTARSKPADCAERTAAPAPPSIPASSFPSAICRPFARNNSSAIKVIRPDHFNGINTQPFPARTARGNGLWVAFKMIRSDHVNGRWASPGSEKKDRFLPWEWPTPAGLRLVRAGAGLRRGGGTRLVCSGSGIDGGKKDFR